MENKKFAKIFGALCIVSLVMIIVEAVLAMIWGFRIFGFDPTPESSTKEIQVILNAFSYLLRGILSSLPMFFGLLAFYFSGAVGKSVWSKVLLGLLVLVFFVEAGVWFGFDLMPIFRAFDSKLLDEGIGNDIHLFWFIPFAGNFLRMVPFIAVVYSVTALIERRVSTSVALSPALAAAIYMFLGYAYVRSKMDLPDYFAIAIFIGLAGMFFGGAIGKSIWSKLLFAGLLALFISTFAMNLIATSVDFLGVFDIGRGIAGSSAFGWFKAFGGIKYVFLSLLTIIFGIAVFVSNKDNSLVGVAAISAGVLYVFSSLIPDSANLFRAEAAGILFQPLGVFNISAIAWSLVGFAVLGITRLAKPFLILVIAVSGIITFIGVFMAKDTNDLLAFVFAAFVVGMLVQLILTFYMWNAIDDGKTPIKAWIAVAGGIIPFIGTIWSLIILSKYPKAYDDYIDRKNLTASYISRTPFWMYIVFFVLSTIFFWIPYVGKVFGFAAFISAIGLIFAGCSAVNRLRGGPIESNANANLVDNDAVLGIS